jgi:hypothetical protein
VLSEARFHKSVKLGEVLCALAFAKTPRRLNFIHATCYTNSLDVVDFKCAPDFGEDNFQ